jgi:hypothetical protein
MKVTRVYFFTGFHPNWTRFFTNLTAAKRYAKRNGLIKQKFSNDKNTAAEIYFKDIPGIAIPTLAASFSKREKRWLNFNRCK